MKAQERPDILAELFRGDEGGGTIAGLEELDALIHACVAPKTPSTPRESKKLLPLQKKRRSKKRKSTHYLREEVYDGLSQAKQSLKRLLPEGAKLRASKSNLVNFAVNKLLQEIEDKGLESSLARMLLEGKKE